MVVIACARWSGFAVTVVALVVFATWWRRLGASVEPQFSLTHLTNDVVLFVAFAGHHSLFARRAAKARVLRLVPPELERTVYVCVASVLLVSVSHFWSAIGGVLYDASGAFAAFLYLLQAAGVVVGVLAVRHFSVRELVGMTAAAALQQLEHKGPYRIVRHPLYTSLVVMLAATPRMTGDRLLFVVLLLAYLAIAIPLEERSLAAQFGDAYRVYRSRVRWRLIPYVH